MSTVPAMDAAAYSGRDTCMNTKGKTIAKMDIAMYGESNLYEMHSRKYGEIPSGSTAKI